MTYFNQTFGNGKDQLPIEADRYRLIRAATCPYAHRAAIARQLLGLDDVISMGTVDSVSTSEGWLFRLDPDQKDPVLEVKSIRDIYYHTIPDYNEAFSVPILVDVPSGKIVRRESHEILRDFSVAFKALHSENAPDLYPDQLAHVIDEWNERIMKDVADQVYVIGFSENQADYEAAIDTFFRTLDEIDYRLSKQRYMHGDALSETDIILFTPLVRLDIVYNPLFNANKKRLTDYTHLWGYMRELYQMPAFQDTTDFNAIKKGYYTGTSGELWGKGNIVPVGPDTSIWLEPHDRQDETYHFWH